MKNPETVQEITVRHQAGEVWLRCEKEPILDMTPDAARGIARLLLQAADEADAYIHTWAIGFGGRRVSVDGRFDERQAIRFLGDAVEQFDGTWRCLADVGGSLCLVEVTLRFEEQ